jgi:serine/threonine-protein kinase LATS1/2
MRQQAIRDQAEAVAQVQAAMHQDSIIQEQPRQLHIVNGAPSLSQTVSQLTIGTTTTATIGHGSGNSPLEARQAFNGIAEEQRGSDGEAQDAPYPAELSTPPSSPPGRRLGASPSPAARPIAPGFPRSNTGGTMLVAQSPEPAQAGMDAPDYLAYMPAVEPKSIEGLPGAAPGGIGALFAADPAARPTSMVVRDADVPMGGLVLHRQATAETLPERMALNAGAALRPSLTTVEKSVAAKIFFENLYYGILKAPRARDTRRAGLEAELASLRIPEASKEAIRAKWIANETEYLRDIRARVNVNSFAKLKTIGHGAFGVVALCRERGTGELFAMKQLRKADMLRKGQEGHVRAERDLMTSASASASAKWIVKLVYSFQDVDHLYLIM